MQEQAVVVLCVQRRHDPPERNTCEKETIVYVKRDLQQRLKRDLYMRQREF